MQYVIFGQAYHSRFRRRPQVNLRVQFLAQIFFFSILSIPFRVGAFQRFQKVEIKTIDIEVEDGFAYSNYLVVTIGERVYRYHYPHIEEAFEYKAKILRIVRKINQSSNLIDIDFTLLDLAKGDGGLDVGVGVGPGNNVGLVISSAERSTLTPDMAFQSPEN